MKRFLSWLALIGCYFLFCFIVALDMALLSYVLDLYSQLSAFLKLVILIIGGSFVLGIAFAPLFYGIPLIITACEAICPSKRGTRYTVFGIFVLVCCVAEIFMGFMLRDILIGIFAISLIVCGRSKAKDYKENNML